MAKAKISATAIQATRPNAMMSWADEILAKEGAPKLPGELGEPFFERVPISAIRVDRTYQRALSPAKLKDKRDHFDEAALAVIVLSMRNDGTFWVIDGQHRMAVAREKLGDGYRIRALVYIDLTLEQEARLFKYLNGTKWNKAMGSHDEYRALLVEKDPGALRMQLAINRTGFRITNEQKLGEWDLGCISAMQKICKEQGPEHLERSLHVIGRSWDGEPIAGRYEMVEGMSMFLGHYPDIDELRLVRLLSAVSPAKMIQQAAAMAGLGYNRPTIVAQLLRDVYNKRLGGDKRLGSWDDAHTKFLSRQSKAGAARREALRRQNGGG